MKYTTNRRAAALFAYHAWQHKRLFLPLIITIPAAVLLLDIIKPLIISNVLQTISAGHYNHQQPIQAFSNSIVLYIICTILGDVAMWRLNILFIWNLEANVMRDIAQRVFKHLLRMSPNFHANNFGGSLVSQANKLTTAYVQFADATFFELYTLITALVASFVILAPRVPIYAVIMILLAALYIVGAFYFSRPVREASRQESERESEQTGNLADAITNVTAIKSFARGKHEEARYWQAASRTRKATQKNIKATTIREIYASSITGGISVIALLIAVIGAGRLHANIATLFLIVNYTGSLGQRLWEFQNTIKNYNRAFGNANNMVEILAIEPEIRDPEKPQTAKIRRGQIDFKQVTFRHSGNKQDLFADLSVRIKSGEKVGLVGQSGSGKTTFTKLLLRYSDINSGTITIDSQDIQTITQDDLRRHISYVPQEPLLFHRSLAENIAYGRPEATQQEIEAIAKMAHAHEFISELPDGYETLVGERGVKLSGGQRQRVAIARAMLKNASILVLDEATSALDSESEALIQDALWKLMEGRTAIVIAHRLSTIQRMDRIIVLHEGQIVEQGSHKDLLHLNGTYAKLWAHQSGGFIEE